MTIKGMKICADVEIKRVSCPGVFFRCKDSVGLHKTNVFAFEQSIFLTRCTCPFVFLAFMFELQLFLHPSL